MTKVEKIYLQKKEQALKEQAYDFAQKMLNDLVQIKLLRSRGFQLKRYFRRISISLEF